MDHITLVSLVTLLGCLVLVARRSWGRAPKPPTLSGRKVWEVRHASRTWGVVKGDWAPARFRIDSNPSFADGALTLQLHRVDLGIDPNELSSWLSVGFLAQGQEGTPVLNLYKRFRGDDALGESLQLLAQGLRTGTVVLVPTEKEGGDSYRQKEVSE